MANSLPESQMKEEDEFSEKLQYQFLCKFWCDVSLKAACLNDEFVKLSDFLVAHKEGRLRISIVPREGDHPSEPQPETEETRALKRIKKKREEEVRLKREWEQGLFLARLEAEKTAQFPGDPTPLGITTVWFCPEFKPEAEYAIPPQDYQMVTDSHQDPNTQA